jgi:hypothetical protein
MAPRHSAENHEAAHYSAQCQHANVHGPNKDYFDNVCRLGDDKVTRILL